MNQKYSKFTALNRHQCTGTWQNTFREALNPSTLKNNLTNSVNSKGPVFIQSLLFKGVGFSKWMTFPHFSHHTSTKWCPRRRFQASCSLRPGGFPGRKWSPFSQRPAHTSACPPGEKWLQEAAPVQRSVPFDVITSACPTLRNAHYSHWT